MPRFAHMRNQIFSAVLVLLLGFNASSHAQEAEAAKPQAHTGPDVIFDAKLAQIDSATVEYVEHRTPTAQATIVFENGLLLDFSTWKAVAAGLKQCCNLLFYNRPGVGRSTLGDREISPASESMRLHQLLQARDLAPPYVLVGHSLGGQYAQAYAKRYPEQVSGMVLVDALPLGVAKPYQDFPLFTRLGLSLFASKAARQEIANIDAMSKYVMEQPGFFRKPMVRIVAQSSSQQEKPQGLVRDLLRGVVYAENFGIWAIDPDTAESHMSSFYPHAELRTFPAKHRIQEQYPELVIDAISSVIKQQKNPCAPGISPADCAASAF